MSRTADQMKRLFRGLVGTSVDNDAGGGFHGQVARRESEESSLHVGMASHTGLRDSNEDYAAVSWRGDFFAVSDGIGGAPYGDVMSRLACNTAVRAYDEGVQVREAFEVANEATSLVSDLLGERSGATLLLAQREDSTLRIVSAGDTRAFLLRGGRLEALNGDGRAQVGSNALAKAVGYGPIEPDETSVTLAYGDRILLCTDGVWEYLSRERLVSLLGSGENAPMAAEDIAWEASRVGEDNGTCICVFVDDIVEMSTPHLDAYGPNTPSTAFLLEA